MHRDGSWRRVIYFGLNSRRCPITSGSDQLVCCITQECWGSHFLFRYSTIRLCALSSKPCRSSSCSAVEGLRKLGRGPTTGLGARSPSLVRYPSSASCSATVRRIQPLLGSFTASHRPRFASQESCYPMSGMSCRPLRALDVTRVAHANRCLVCIYRAAAQSRKRGRGVRDGVLGGGGGGGGSGGGSRVGSALDDNVCCRRNVSLNE